MRCHIQLDLMVNRVTGPEEAADLAEAMLSYLDTFMPTAKRDPDMHDTVTKHERGARIAYTPQHKRRMKGRV